MNKSPRKLPAQELLQQLLSYDPSTGELRWKPRPLEMFTSERAAKSWASQNLGKLAFNTNCNGYKTGKIQGEQHWAHRVIWKLMTGEDPDVIDHLDGNPANNAWSNLKATDTRGNAMNQRRPRNNVSGVVGVYWIRSESRWKASIAGKYLGTFDTFEEAVAARKAAEKVLGYSGRHGL